MIRKAHLSLWLRSAKKSGLRNVRDMQLQTSLPLFRKIARDWDFLVGVFSGLAEPDILWGDPPESDEELLLLTTLIGDKYLGTSIKSTS